MLAQPPHDLWIGFRLYGFAENIGVDEESHSIGTDKLYKKPVDAGVVLGERLPHEDGEAVGGGGGG